MTLIDEARDRLSNFALALARLLGPEPAGRMLIGAGITCLRCALGDAGAAQYCSDLALELEKMALGDATAIVSDDARPSVN